MKRGVCDIARANRMADADLALHPGRTLLIPSEVCKPDNNSCLLARQNATATCILGGPHTYQTVQGDTLESIALKKFNITTATLMKNTRRRQGGNITVTTPLNPGMTIKIPQCSPSQCVVQPYHLTYGTYRDLAARVGTTVGQIMAFNPGYTTSQAEVGEGPVLTIPMDCTALSTNMTIID
ncbi:hypothetical protein BT63DRAFT_480426 [Microthyrium microscopicum]|uniref:LysM domain-containing protein n=1 Tax=Microthyrium microscopicum TaxID=703497 RepID=A0A6A6U989_9PEZI|nr:hypothetical protein BT63DRAFT_480426 [Microthyrium microscopicum]